MTHPLNPGDEARETILRIIRDQPFYPDTHTGSRQQWVKDQIAEKVGALFGALPPVEEAAAVPGGADDQSLLITGDGQRFQGKAARVLRRAAALTASEAVGTVPREANEPGELSEDEITAWQMQSWAHASAPALAGENVEAVAWRWRFDDVTDKPNWFVQKRKPDMMRWPDVICEPLVPAALSRLQAPKNGTDSRDETITNYSKTVSRIWEALGVTTYEEAGGKHIHELVADLKARVDQLGRNNTGLWDNYTRVLSERDTVDAGFVKLLEAARAANLPLDDPQIVAAVTLIEGIEQ